MHRRLEAHKCPIRLCSLFRYGHEHERGPETGGDGLASISATDVATFFFGNELGSKPLHVKHIAVLLPALGFLELQVGGLQQRVREASLGPWRRPEVDDKR